MTSVHQISQDLDYVASAVRHHDRDAGPPATYFLWAAIVLVGYALPDFAPRMAGPYWFVAGIGGGLLSWWLGERHSRRSGIGNSELGKRYGLHWMIAGFGFILAALPMMVGSADYRDGSPIFMLVAGLVYSLAGVHLTRPLLWVGLLLLAAYAVMVIATPPYVWTITGVVIALALAATGLVAARLNTVAPATSLQ